jgi:peptidoglycan/xylan/chitin deacetylase (PgdA/CDA1 family)
MPRVPRGAPFDERGNRLRGVLDLAAGRYPGFLFGRPVGDILPVFHFHETTAAALEPAFAYLRDNDYRTVGTDALARLVLHGQHPGPRTVMLNFDDAWSSLWLVVGPLLANYGLSAVTFAIPARVVDAPKVRPTMGNGPVDAEAADRAANPFATWPELRALSASGRVEVQSHSWSHSMIFSDSDPFGVVRPDYSSEPVLVRPRVNASDPPEFLEPGRLGYPLFARRSRLSSARRFEPDADACATVERFVSSQGGERFFERPDADAALRARLGAVKGTWEADDARVRAIDDELGRSRDELQKRVGAPVRHMCLPWGVTSHETRAGLERLGYLTAFANRPAGRLAVAAGDDPYFLKRLHSRHIFALPGKGRRVFVTLA